MRTPRSALCKLKAVKLRSRTHKFPAPGPEGVTQSPRIRPGRMRVSNAAQQVRAYRHG